MPIVRVIPKRVDPAQGYTWTVVGGWLDAIQTADGSTYHTINTISRNETAFNLAREFDFSPIPDGAIINAIRGVTIFRWVTGTGSKDITASLYRSGGGGTISEIVTQDRGTGAWTELATPWVAPIPEYATGAAIKASNVYLAPGWTELYMSWRVTNSTNKLQTFDVDQLAIDVDYTVDTSGTVAGVGSVIAEGKNPNKTIDWIYAMSSTAIWKYLGDDLTIKATQAVTAANCILVDDFVYVGDNNNYIKKYSLSDLTYIGQLLSDGGAVREMVSDDNFIYASMGAYIGKILKPDLTFAGGNYRVYFGSNILSMAQDNTHLYVGGNSKIVKKYLKSDMSLVASSTVLYDGSYIDGMAVDATYVYVGGSGSNVLKKYLKSDLSYVGETVGNEAFTSIYKIRADDTYLYVTGNSTSLHKYLKSDLSAAGTIPFNAVAAASDMDDVNLYIVGYHNLKKYNKSDSTLLVTAPDYPGGADELVLFKELPGPQPIIGYAESIGGTAATASKSTSGSAATNNSTSAASTAGKGVSGEAVVGATQSATSDYVLTTIAEGFGEVTGVGESISVGGKSAVGGGLTTSNQSVTAAGNIQLAGEGIATATQTANATDGTKASLVSGDISATQTADATYTAMATGSGFGDISSVSASIAIGSRGTSADADSIVGSSASATALAQRASSSQASATQEASSSGIKVISVSGDAPSVSAVVSGYSVQRSNQGSSSNVAEVFADGFLQLDAMIAGSGDATVVASVTSTYGPPQRLGSSAVTAAGNVSAIGTKKAGNGAAIVSVSGISVSLYSTQRSGGAYVSGSEDVNSAHTRLSPFKIAENYSIHVINKKSAYVKETPVDGQHTLGGDFSHHVSGRR